VLLLNLGGPETLDDVQPFLYNLFSDPDIIRLPTAAQFLQPLIATLISTLRAPKSAEGCVFLVHVPCLSCLRPEDLHCDSHLQPASPKNAKMVRVRSGSPCACSFGGGQLCIQGQLWGWVCNMLTANVMLCCEGWHGPVCSSSRRSRVPTTICKPCNMSGLS